MTQRLNGRVLFVDDAPQTRKVISKGLLSAEHVVQTAVDGPDALKTLRAGLPDLIISDLKMPRMSGLELLNVVRKRFPLQSAASDGLLRADLLRVDCRPDLTTYSEVLGFNPRALRAKHS
jgi:CheY-like chemotaxis protein